MITIEERDAALDLIFASLQDCERQMRGILKDLVLIRADRLPSSKKEEIADGNNAILAVLESRKEMLRQTPGNPNVPKYRFKTKNEYREISVKLRQAKRRERLERLRNLPPLTGPLPPPPWRMPRCRW